MYISPKMTTYANEDLVELIGPVENQYVPLPPPACECNAPGDVSVVPETFLVGKDNVRLEVDVSGCPEFQTVQVRMIDGTGGVLISTSFQRTQGSLSNGTWTLDPWAFGFAPPEDMYRVEVVLIESLTCRSQPVFGAFVVE